MYIVMVTPEITPAAKVGGLADVIVGLSRELVSMGHNVDVICPMYSCMRYDQIEDLHEVYSELWVPHYNEWRSEKVFQGKVSGINTYFITGGNYTEREKIYGYDDDMFRFVYFNRAVMEFMYKTEKRPEIIHCHDWQTALIPAMYYDIYGGLGWNDSRVIFTIHNTECQGLCWYGQKLLDMVQMDVGRYHQPDKMQDDSKANCINLMRGAIVYSNFVTTVSPTYAGEIKNADSGRGLQHVLNSHSAKLGGVINGIDYDVWDPATDKKICHNYSTENFVDKYKNKYGLREWLQLDDVWKPIVSVVTRLTQQKGLDLIKHAIYSTLRMGGQFVLLGESPDPAVNADFWRIKNELADCRDVHLWIGYHEDLAHLIYAGSDMFLVPSIFEPCGLTQLIALRYGTVPVVRETGGLADTVLDVDNSGLGLAGSNGYSFKDANPAGLDYALGRAIDCWTSYPETFNKLAQNGMKFDYSWKNPGIDYENIYNYVKAK
ncbi:MAG: glycogen synthase [Planctomycetes bacterium]|nr:glycogen synthase [Planctomycetota bacterium]